jgi:hypothetical protein
MPTEFVTNTGSRRRRVGHSDDAEAALGRAFRADAPGARTPSGGSAPMTRRRTSVGAAAQDSIGTFARYLPEWFTIFSR